MDPNRAEFDNQVRFQTYDLSKIRWRTVETDHVPEGGPVLAQCCKLRSNFLLDLKESALCGPSSASETSNDSAFGGASIARAAPISRDETELVDL